MTKNKAGESPIYAGSPNPETAQLLSQNGCATPPGFVYLVANILARSMREQQTMVESEHNKAA